MKFPVATITGIVIHSCSKGMIELYSMAITFTDCQPIYHSIHAYLTQAVPLFVSLYWISRVIEQAVNQWSFQLWLSIQHAQMYVVCQLAGRRWSKDITREKTWTYILHPHRSNLLATFTPYTVTAESKPSKIIWEMHNHRASPPSLHFNRHW